VRPAEGASVAVPAPALTLPNRKEGRGRPPARNAAARFVRRPEDDAQDTWEQRLVKRYYDRLYKEYCLADLRHYKKGQVWDPVLALRGHGRWLTWRCRLAARVATRRSAFGGEPSVKCWRAKVRRRPAPPERAVVQAVTLTRPG